MRDSSAGASLFCEKSPQKLSLLINQCARDTLNKALQTKETKLSDFVINAAAWRYGEKRGCKKINRVERDVAADPRSPSWKIAIISYRAEAGAWMPIE